MFFQYMKLHLGIPKRYCHIIWCHIIRWALYPISKFNKRHTSSRCRHASPRPLRAGRGVRRWEAGRPGQSSSRRPRSKTTPPLHRVVQLNFTPEIEVFHMLFDRFYFSMTSLKQHMEYFNFTCSIQLDQPVWVPLRFSTECLSMTWATS